MFSVVVTCAWPRMRLTCATSSARSMIRWLGNDGPEWYEEPLEELELAITVLDIIGWSSNNQPAQVTLDAHEHRRVLLEAVDTVLLIADDNLEEMAKRAQAKRQARPARAARGRPERLRRDGQGADRRA
jgi:hypothetical protein